MAMLDLFQCREIVKKSICDALEIKEINDVENFFDIGGDSLTALDVIDKMFEFSGIKITIVDFMVAPVPEKLAEVLYSRAGYNVS